MYVCENPVCAFGFILPPSYIDRRPSVCVHLPPAQSVTTDTSADGGNTDDDAAETLDVDESAGTEELTVAQPTQREHAGNATLDNADVQPAADLVIPTNMPAANNDLANATGVAATLGIDGGMLTGNVEADETKVRKTTPYVYCSNPCVAVHSHSRVPLRAYRHPLEPHA